MTAARTAAAGRRPRDHLLRRRPATPERDRRGPPPARAARRVGEMRHDAARRRLGGRRRAPPAPHLHAAQGRVPAVPDRARSVPSEIPERDYDVVVFENRFPSYRRHRGRPADGARPDRHLRHAARPSAAARSSASRATTRRRSRTCPPSGPAPSSTRWADRTAALGCDPARSSRSSASRTAAARSASRCTTRTARSTPTPTCPPRTQALLEAARATTSAPAGCSAPTSSPPSRPTARGSSSRGEHWTAYVPFAARWPVEVHLAPHRDVPDLVALDDDERDELAAHLPRPARPPRPLLRREDGSPVGCPTSPAGSRPPPGRDATCRGCTCRSCRCCARPGAQVPRRARSPASAAGSTTCPRSAPRPGCGRSPRDGAGAERRRAVPPPSSDLRQRRRRVCGRRRAGSTSSASTPTTTAGSACRSPSRSARIAAVPAATTASLRIASRPAGRRRSRSPSTTSCPGNPAAGRPTSPASCGPCGVAGQPSRGLDVAVDGRRAARCRSVDARPPSSARSPRRATCSASTGSDRRRRAALAAAASSAPRTTSPARPPAAWTSRRRCSCGEGHALLLDCRAARDRHVPFDLDAAGLALLVIDTQAEHALVDGQYAARRDACEQAARELGVETLRESPAPASSGSGAARPTTCGRRVRHVVTEIERVARPSRPSRPATSTRWAALRRLARLAARRLRGVRARSSTSRRRRRGRTEPWARG